MIPGGSRGLLSAAVVLVAASAAGAQTLDARIHAAAAPGVVTWVGYRVPGASGRRRMCDSDRFTKIILEAPTEALILARIENGALTRIRTATPDCEIDATGARLVWLTGVSADDSVAWLSSLVSGAAQDRATVNHIADPALAALSVHGGDAAAAALVGFARQHPLPRLRGQALFWLARRAGDRALATIVDAVTDDPEIEVKKRAVFALSQLPKDEGVPKLIDLARTNRAPEVRRQAFFWLGQSKDPRAVQFFEEILLKQP